MRRCVRAAIVFVVACVSLGLAGAPASAATLTVTINQKGSPNPQPDPTNALPIKFDVSFSASVSGFTAADVTLGGTAPGASATISGGPKNYTVNVTVTGNGTVTAAIPAGAAQDGSSNLNTASTSDDDTVTYDGTRPSVTVTQQAGQSDPTNTQPILFDVVFSEPVADFAAEDVTLLGGAGTANGGTPTVVSGSGTTYVISISGLTSDGTVTPRVQANNAHDAAGNGNTGSAADVDRTVTLDTKRPSVAVTQQAGQSDPTNTQPILFDVVFSEPVADFAAEDVTLAGGAGAADGGTATVVSGSGTTYVISISGLTSDGTVTPRVQAGGAHDAAGNSNTNSANDVDRTVTYDTRRPNVTINQAAGQSDPTNTQPILFDVVFSEDVTGFTADDVTLGGTAPGATASVTGSGATYVVSVSGLTGDGTVTAAIAANRALDLAGNANRAATSTDATVTYDATRPGVTINQAAGQSDPTNTQPILFDVVFSEPVTGFAADDVSLTGGTAPGATASVSGSGTTYVVSVSGLTGDGSVVVAIPAGAALDAAGNSNTVATSTDASVTYDTTAPDTIIDAGPADVISPATTATFEFHATESGSTLSCRLDTGTPEACNSGTITYTGLPYGSHTFTVVATDPAGNADASPATWTFRVNAPPVAAPDAYTAVSGAPLVVNATSGVLANDSDADGDAADGTARHDDGPRHAGAQRQRIVHVHAWARTP